MRSSSRTALAALAVTIAGGLLIAALAGWFIDGPGADTPPVTTIAAIDASKTTTTLLVTTSGAPTTTHTDPGVAAPDDAGAFGQRSGALPDGTLFRIHAEPALSDAIEAEDVAANEVRFESFVVTDGCGALAVACNNTNAVQVVPIDPDGWNEDQFVWIESDAPRPTTDTAYLDPGPLQPRGGHDVLWTGAEMIVWGGAAGDRPAHLIDGAAFDPTTSTWRTLGAPPFEGETTTRAVWAGDRMLVVSNAATVAYDPALDTWEVVGDGAVPSRSAGFMAWTGADVVMLNQLGVHRFEPATGVWLEMGAPPAGTDLSPWHGALRIVDGVPYVLGNAGSCAGRRVARWDGAEWVELPPVSLATETYADCSFPNQTAVVAGTLMVWEDNEHPTKLLRNGEWFDTGRIPLSGTEGDLGPLSIGDRVLVPQWGTGTIYDPGTETWTGVIRLPGDGLPSDMVWTGNEVLMWGATCCYGGGGPFSIDAWRWTPLE